MTVTATWPDSSAGPTIGDGRFAHAIDRPLDVEALCHSVKVLDGELDDVPEGDFYMKGGIDEVVAAKK